MPSSARGSGWLWSFVRVSEFQIICSEKLSEFPNYLHRKHSKGARRRHQSCQDCVKLSIELHLRVTIVFECPFNTNSILQNAINNC